MKGVLNVSECSKHKDYSRFDAMDTDQLKEMLYRDSLLPDSEESDTDTLLYIMEVIARREQQESASAFVNVDAAWKSFNENYFPAGNDGQSLYDDTNSESQREIADTQRHPFTSRRPIRRGQRIWARIASVAALLAVLVFAGSLTAYAFGYDLWGAVAQWPQEFFRFKSDPAEQSQQLLPDNNHHPALDGLYQLMDEDGLPGSLLPEYLPEGYEPVTTKVTKMSARTDYYCHLQSDTGSINVIYSVYPDGNFMTQFEKDPGDPEIYNSNGTTYYIMTNVGRYRAAWTSGNIECRISGVASRDEIIKIIDSIAGG